MQSLFKFFPSVVKPLLNLTLIGFYLRFPKIQLQYFKKKIEYISLSLSFVNLAFSRNAFSSNIFSSFVKVWFLYIN